ncbi:hypothetical protein GW17_00017751 [Ensete ventricosum]|nr:hypothetical protein GW17_00017751 [Ensete ventricosum]
MAGCTSGKSRSSHFRFHFTLQISERKESYHQKLSKKITVEDLILGREHTATKEAATQAVPGKEDKDLVVSEILAIAKAVADRANMHAIIGARRNSLESPPYELHQLYHSFRIALGRNVIDTSRRSNTAATTAQGSVRALIQHCDRNDADRQQAGPIFAGLATIGSGLLGASALGPLRALLAVAGGSLATVVNTLEHAGQVGMVFEVFRNNAGFYRWLQEEFEFSSGEEDLEKRENGELFKLKLALQLLEHSTTLCCCL